MLLPVGPIYHGTPKHDEVVKVLHRYSRAGAENRQGESAIHPLAKDQGLSGPFSVTLRPVTQENWRAALRLGVRPDHMRFVAEYAPIAAIALAKAYLHRGGPT